MARRIIFELVSTKTLKEDRENRNVGLKTYTGTMFFGPTPGKSFSFFRDDAEYVHTSTVKNIEYVDANTLLVSTKNSEYKLIIGEDTEPK